MTKYYRLVFECYDPVSESKEPLNKATLISGVIEKPVDIFTCGFNHEQQISLIQFAQDALLKEQITLIDSESENCLNCQGTN